MLTTQRHKNLDFTDLQEEVCLHWDSEGKQWAHSENVGYTPPDPVHFEVVIEPWAEEILDDPIACINELGYDKISQYIAAKREEDGPEILPPGIIGSLHTGYKGFIAVNPILLRKPTISSQEIALDQAVKVSKGFDNIVDQIDSTFRRKGK